MLNENIEDRHILEERGKVELSEDYDEEKKFSAVIGSGRYVEPNKDMDIKFKPCPLKFVNKKKEIDKTQEGEKKNIAENFGKKDDNINKPKENKDIYIEKPPNLEKFQENIEIKTFSQENKDYNLEQQSIDRLDSSEKISLKNKKLAEKSLKLNSVSFFAGNKGNSNVAISEFKPANEKMIQNNDKTIISEKPTEKVTPIIEKASPIIEKLINKQNLNTVINIPTNEKLEVKEEKITNLSKPPVDQFKLYSGDVHLSIK